MILILEDTNDKLHTILLKYGEMLLKLPIFIARTQWQAEAFVQMHRGPITLFLDQELMGGTGYEFLSWMLTQHPRWLNRVVITTYSLEYASKMQVLCNSNSIPVEKLP